MRFIGVELDGISGRIARVLNPKADIRIENFRDTRLPELDAVVGNVPFADLKLDHRGRKWSLHDYFFAKSVDALKPGGALALVTSRYTLDKQNAAIREYLASKADFVGAIRLPSDALELTSQCPRKESITGLPPARNTQAGGRSSVHTIGWDGASA
jgi:adenine-specific DNA methylase